MESLLAALLCGVGGGLFATAALIVLSAAVISGERNDDEWIEW